MAEPIGRFLGRPLSSEERRRVLEDLFVFGRENQRPYLRRMGVLLVLSTVIAACGLMADSAAVVIGAMLVAPMMRPVMAAAAAIPLGWSARFYGALALVFAMAIAAVAIATAIAFVSPDFLEVPSQVLARTEPTFFDLVIALAAGAGGAYTLTRRESSAIPGVAMAVALLPPLASTGILLDFGEVALALRAFTLFGINFLAMILAGALTFLATGVSPANVVSRSVGFIVFQLSTFLVLIFATSVPLWYYSTDVWYDDAYRAAHNEALQGWLHDNQLELAEVQIDEAARVLRLDLRGPDPPMTIEGLFDLLVANGAPETGWSLDVSWTQQTRSSWPPPIAPAAEPEAETKEVADLVRGRWAWRATQRDDETWIGLQKTAEYTLALQEGGRADVVADCRSIRGSHEVTGRDLRLEVPPGAGPECEDPELELAFLSDLNRVVGMRLEDDALVLRLDNDAGLMFFDRAPQDMGP